MSSSRETERLLATLLSDAREAPTPEDLERVELRLGTWLGPDRAPPRPARSSGRSLAWKVVLAVAGVGLVSYVFHGGSPPPGDLPPEVAPSVTAILPVAPEPSPAPSVHIADLPSVTAVMPGASSAPAPTTATSAAPRTGARPRTGHVAATPAHPAEASAVALEPAGEAESEAGFLRRTRAALAGDPARALRMTEEHAARFPRGVLVQERDVIAIDALVRLGRRDEARAKAMSFRARYPSSAHASRIAAIVGTE